MEVEAKSQPILRLQNSLSSPIIINDASVDIIEINLVSTGKESYCAPHIHTWFELNYAIKNNMHTGIGSDTFEVCEDEFFLIPPGIEHYHIYNPIAPHECFVIRWILKKCNSSSCNEENSFFDTLNKLCCFKPHAVKDNYGISNLFELMLKEAEDGYNPVSLQLLIVKIISILSDLCFDKSLLMVEKDIGFKSLVRKVEVLLNDNFLKEFTIDSIARSLHMSYGHLTRMYKKKTGSTILKRLNQIRIEKSKEMLLNTDYSIKEISFKVGFDSQFYFSRLFRLKTGMTPSEFRQNKMDTI